MNLPAHFHFDTAWPDDRWQTLVCRAAWDETHDVRTFLLAPADGLRIAFDPGQFLTFRARIDGEIVERCYTISSSAAVAETVTITVKRKPEGRMSGYLHETLRPGARIEALGPAGGFGRPERAEKLLLISAGSGVTPMASILATAADLGQDFDVVFLHAARTPSDVILADAWPRLARRLPGLRVVLAASRCQADWKTDWTGIVGRLGAAALLTAVPDLAERTVLCCGPEGFMETVRRISADAGVRGERYLEENFDFGAQTIDAETIDAQNIEAPKPDVGVSHTVTFAKTGRAFAVSPGLTILQAAKAAGVPLASACAQGRCGTCKSRKLSGAVAMAHRGGIRQREIDAGLILPCCSHPETDVTLDR